MSLLVALLVVTLVTPCWAAPQRRGWTPQAILYLKGAQGHRSVLERITRGGGHPSYLVSHSQRGDGLGLSSVLLELLQQAVEDGGGNPDNTDEEELDF